MFFSNNYPEYEEEDTTLDFSEKLRKWNNKHGKKQNEAKRRDNYWWSKD